MSVKRLVIAGFGLSLSAVTGTVMALSAIAPAVAADFSAGNILANANMYNSNPTMNAQQIDEFIRSKQANCSDGGGRVCLKNQRFDTRSFPADQYCPAAYQAATGETAGQVIYKVAKACNITPQTILVTLQKEQSLITRAGTSRAYEIAMGYACPDGRPCNSAYYGFQNQVYQAAHQFQRYRLYPNKFTFAEGRTSYTQYNVDKSCGGSEVKMQTQATASLYNYTPYQPYPDELKGIKHRCNGAGNYNFFKLYRSWFGDPQAPSGQPIAGSATPATSNNGATGTMDNTLQQGANGKADPNLPSSAGTVVEGAGKATKPAQPVEAKIEKVMINGADVIQEGASVPAGKPLTVELVGFDPKATLTTMLNDVEDSGLRKAVNDRMIFAMQTPKANQENVLKVIGQDLKHVTKTLNFKFKSVNAPIVVKPESIKVDGQINTLDGDLQPGQQVEMTLYNLTPNTQPKVVVHSNPQVLTTGTVSGQGTLPISFKVPSESGKHRILVTDNGKETEVATFNVAPKQLQVRPASNSQPVATKVTKRPKTAKLTTGQPASSAGKTNSAQTPKRISTQERPGTDRTAGGTKGRGVDSSATSLGVSVGTKSQAGDGQSSSQQSANSSSGLAKTGSSYPLLIVLFSTGLVIAGTALWRERRANLPIRVNC